MFGTPRTKAKQKGLWKQKENPLINSQILTEIHRNTSVSEVIAAHSLINCVMVLLLPTFKTSQYYRLHGLYKHILNV